MNGSIRFDRAAEFYDRTRALGPQARESVTRLLASELRGKGRSLEIGVGTGRIALPLHAAGMAMAGVDLSAPMLGVLVRKAGTMPFPLALADATRLPFAASTFGGALACHVLHLIPGWRDAVDELVRVVSRPGVVLVEPGRVGSEPDPLERAFREAAGVKVRDVGLQRVEELDEEMSALGATVRELEPIEDRRTSSVNERLEAWERNLYSFTWRIPDEVRLAAAAQTRAWAERNVGDLDAPVERTVRVRWRAYDL